MRILLGILIWAASAQLAAAADPSFDATSRATTAGTCEERLDNTSFAFSPCGAPGKDNRVLLQLRVPMTTDGLDIGEATPPQGFRLDSVRDTKQ